MLRAQVVLVSLLLLGSVAAAATLQPLGDLPGDIFGSVAFGVSADGSTVVGGSNSASGTQAFRWTSAGGMQGLGDLSGGDFGSSASGVSADGSTVVGIGTCASGGEAFRWTAGGGMVGLGHLPGGIYSSTAADVSADGSIVVGYSYSEWGYETAFRWTADEGMVALEGDPETNIRANAVSGNGATIVGQYGRKASVWVGDGWDFLGDLPDSSANGVNDAGTVVGYSSGQAFLWPWSGGMVGLGHLPGSTANTSAWDVSDDGSVVVGYSAPAPGGGYEAVRWTAGSGMQRLWDVLLAQGVNPAADGWTILSEAYAVSADGNTIVGYGTRNGNTEAFRVVLPSIPCSSFVAPDLDRDCDVDAQDVAAFKAYASRANVPVRSGCHSSDFDGDGDADMTDFGMLQRCYGNAVQNCAN
jgi:probable HAF family extracellular repeat protein